MTQAPEDSATIGSDAPRLPPRRLGHILLYVGPGMILAGSIVGSGELIATPLVSAKTGFTLLWLIVFGCIVKTFFQIEIGRYALSTGRTTLESFNELPGPRFGVSWLCWCWLIMALCTVVQLGAMAAGVAQALAWSLEEAFTFPYMTEVLGVLVGLSIAGLLYNGKYGRIEHVALTMVVLFTVITLYSLVHLQFSDKAIRTASVTDGMSFQLPTDKQSFLVALTAFGIIGVGASELVAYPYWCLEKGYGKAVGKQDDPRPAVPLEGVDESEEDSTGAVGNIPPKEFRTEAPLSESDVLDPARPNEHRIQETTQPPSRAPLEQAGTAPPSDSIRERPTVATPSFSDEAWLDRAKGWIRVMQIDAWLATVIFTISTVAFFLLGAAMLYPEYLAEGDKALPAGNLMVKKLSGMYSETFGHYSKYVFLVGAVCVLYSTFFTATAANARMLTDWASLYGMFDRNDEASRKQGIAVLSVIIPVVSTLIFLIFGKPVVFVMVGGVAQAIMLPLIGLAVLYFGYKTTDKRLNGGLLWFALLEVAFILMLVASGYGLYKSFIA